MTSKNLLGEITGSNSAGEESKKASKEQAAYQQQALDYLKETEKLPQSLREEALGRMGSLYGFEPAAPELDKESIFRGINDSPQYVNSLRNNPGFNNLLTDLQEGKYEKGTNIDTLIDSIQGHDKWTTGQAGDVWKQQMKGSSDTRQLLEDLLAGEKYGAKDYGGQQGMIDQARNSPLYGAIMGGQKAGEEAIMRNASMTGGLRSGNIQDAFMDYTTQLSNQALSQSYDQQLQGLQGLAGLPSNANAIAQQTSGIGQTLGQGRIGAAQTRQAAKQQDMELLMGIGSSYSDRRLKKDIKKIGEQEGLNVYLWTWNKIAEGLGLVGKSVGYIADEVKEKYPNSVSTHGSGFMMVNYKKIGV